MFAFLVLSVHIPLIILLVVYRFTDRAYSYNLHLLPLHLSSLLSEGWCFWPVASTPPSVASPRRQSLLPQVHINSSPSNSPLVILSFSPSSFHIHPHHSFPPHILLHYLGYFSHFSFPLNSFSSYSAHLCNTSLFFLENWHSPTPRNTKNIQTYTFVSLFSGKFHTHCVT